MKRVIQQLGFSAASNHHPSATHGMLMPALVFSLVCTFSLVSLQSNLFAAAPQTAKRAAAKSDDDTAEEEPTVPAHRGEFKSIKLGEEPASASRAWEWRPYQVAVWICLDGSPELRQIESQLCNEVMRETEVLDPSGWNVTVGTPPSQWRWLFLNSIEKTEKLTGFEDDPELEHYDKLMVVCGRHELGKAKIEVREIDLRTRQWGPLVSGKFAKKNTLASSITRLISKAFMPLASVHSLLEDPKTRLDTAFLRTRGINSCVRVELNEDLEPEVVPIRSSPCYVKDNDYFLPIIRLMDRKGNLKSLKAIDFTFLTIKSIDGPEVQCAIHSTANAPLAGRKKKSAEKLALVIRPPERSTKLTLTSFAKDGKKAKRLEGYEVWSMTPEAAMKPLKDKTEADRELLGLSDWRGEFVIEPTPEDVEGLRMIYIRRAGRNLRKLPIIPGFHDELESALPDDNARLYAEGVIKGLENEILNIVIQRKIYESEIAAAIDNRKRKEASNILRDYKNLESAQDIKTRLANEETRLKALSVSKKETDYITTMFGTLKKLLDSEVVKNRESELQQKLQQLPAR